VGTGSASAAAGAPVWPPPRGAHRNCFAALVFMCHTSTPWALLPANELGCGSATTAWRRLEEWQRAGVFDRLSLVLLDQLGFQVLRQPP
jgi:transposase